MEGKLLTDLFRGRSEEQVNQFREQMKNLMAEAGLPYGDRIMTYNSRLAQELGAWSDTVDKTGKLHDILYTAYFVDNLNIADIPILVGLAEAAGLKSAEAEEVLKNRTFRDTVDQDWKSAMESGITGVPTFTAKDLYVVGCQPYEILERFVTHLQSLQQPSQ